jgi:hypothetical protein
MISVRPGTAKSLLHHIAVSTAAALSAAAVLLVVGASTATAAVSAVGEPPVPASPLVFTVDPHAATTLAGGNIGLADVRRIRQTFKVPAAIDVGQIVIDFDVTGGTGGFNMDFFTVDDVNAANWAATGAGATPVKTITFLSNMPASTNRVLFNLTGSDVFSLPQRNAGTTGYAIEFTTVDQFNNPGQFRHSNTAATDPNTVPPTNPDYYIDGRYYDQNGGSPNGNRDLGLWLLAADPNVPAPGDVDGLNGVDLTDLNIIAANFRKNGNRAAGDLTGNGFVDVFDFREWKSNYPLANSGGGSFEALLGIPEPTSALLLLVGCAGLGCSRRRRS